MRGPGFSIRTRLLILYVSVIGLLSAGVGILTFNQTERLLIADRTEQGRAVVYWALTHTDPMGELRVNDITDIAQKLSFSPSPDLSLFLLDSNGQFLLQLGQGRISYPDPLSSPSFPSAIEGGREAAYIVPADNRGHRTLAYLFPTLGAGGEVLGFIQTEAPLDKVDAALGKLRLGLITGFGVSFVTACLLWFVFTKATLRPVEEMARVSSAVAQGDLSRRITPPRIRDEMYKTALTFNVMMDSIQENVAREKQNQEKMRRFMADAAHEFRSPLTVIKGHTDLLLRGGKENGETLETSLQTINGTVDQLTRLTNDLLTLGRLDAGVGVKPEQVDVTSLCHEVCDIVRVIAGGRDISLSLDRPVMLEADGQLLKRVLWNLLDNAIRHTRAGGTIAVSVVGDGPRCRITVRDDGEGVAADRLPHVFERFYRASRSRTDGTGLGLAIAKAIVEAHGGEISMLSAPGAGATVTFTIPFKTQ